MFLVYSVSCETDCQCGRGVVTRICMYVCMYARCWFFLILVMFRVMLCLVKQIVDVGGVCKVFVFLSLVCAVFSLVYVCIYYHYLCLVKQIVDVQTVLSCFYSLLYVFSSLMYMHVFLTIICVL